MADQETAAASAESLKTLAFFPWLPLREPLDLGRFELLPYSRGIAPVGRGTAEQAACDAVLEVYRAGPKAPVRRATILKLPDRGIIDPVDDATIHRLFIWGELVAFAGLAARRYFDTLGYANRDAFRLVVQRFDDPAKGVAIQSRRRDGSMNAFVSRSAAVFPHPLHATVGPRDQIDVALLAALLDRAERPEWGRYQEALQMFNAANTDDPQVLEEFEVVAILGAFERLFDLSHGNVHELAPLVAAALAGRESVNPSDSSRVQKSAKPAKYTARGSMREVWIRDLFLLRNEHAHGKIEPKVMTLWTRREHLLLASFAFPLVIKHALSSEGYYRMTPEDRQHCNAFEALLEPDHFAEHDGREETSYPWLEVLSAVQMRELAEAMYEQFVRDVGDSAGS